ncbi:hypothetical protein TBK1r_50180 [Stieleria magnilauensis]|uniref:Uncharacterized protein n=1 Tax=Stieleria magnilauensis TaxID=2527963 RepID=A0ABX5XXH0_9BACT|nr:hypothetical protein TBK1r_50180 [Planctomycetes bacterium TBK1r]
MMPDRKVQRDRPTCFSPLVRFQWVNRLYHVKNVSRPRSPRRSHGPSCLVRVKGQPAHCPLPDSTGRSSSASCWQWRLDFCCALQKSDGARLPSRGGLCVRPVLSLSQRKTASGNTTRAGGAAIRLWITRWATRDQNVCRTKTLTTYGQRIQEVGVSLTTRSPMQRRPTVTTRQPSHW